MIYNAITIARPYAKAIFNFSVIQKNIKHWHNMLTVISAISSNKNIQNILKKNMSASVLSELFNTICGNEIDCYAQNLIKIMANHRRLNILPAVLEIFTSMKNDYEKLIEVDLISASKLSNSQCIKIKLAIEKKLSYQVKLNHKIDSSLIAGVIVHLNDLIIDGSVKGRIAHLKHILKS
ncbi:MAG: F0F1 ATP synthase subunit delta [Pantoea sp. Brub]|nr:F0F1 ATP synthase subunit delta [Pantoea sp. Brub]